MKKTLEDEIKRFNKFQKAVLGVENIIKTSHETDIRNYAKYLLREGSKTEKRELLSNLKSRNCILKKRKQKIKTNIS